MTPAMDLAGVKALTFDVFGTVVDWRSTVVQEMAPIGVEYGVDGDWAAFADAWRRGYHEGMTRVNRGEEPWMKVDEIHRRRLGELLAEFGLDSMPDDEREHLNRVWHRLEPWPDAVDGIERLRRRFVVAPLSNGNTSLLTNMAKHAGIPWDCILSSELAGRYKPAPEAYQKAAELLDLQVDEVLMVAAHSSDLRGARGAGLRTAFVSRPLEFGPERAPEAPDASFDIVAADFLDLADRLNA